MVGAMLYTSFGSNEAFKRLLAMGETPFARNQLVEELTRMVAPGTAIQLQIESIRKEADEMLSSDNDVLEAIRNEWLPLYQKMNLLRHNLDKYGRENTEEAITYRKPIAREIKQLERQCAAGWAKRDHYLKEGKLPFVAEIKLEIPTDPMELAKLITNIKRYICRYRLKAAEHPGEPKYAQLYKDYKEQYKLVTGDDYEEKN